MVYEIPNFIYLQLSIRLLNNRFKLLNEDREAEEIIHNIQNQNFCNFKSSLKYNIIASYSDKCEIIDCHTCKIIAENG